MILITIATEAIIERYSTKIGDLWKPTFTASGWKPLKLPLKECTLAKFAGFNSTTMLRNEFSFTVFLHTFCTQMQNSFFVEHLSIVGFGVTQNVAIFFFPWRVFKCNLRIPCVLNPCETCKNIMFCIGQSFKSDRFSAGILVTKIYHELA